MAGMDWAKMGLEGAASLAGGLFGLKAAAKKREQEALMQGQKDRQEAEMMAAKTISDQTPFQQLMQSYGFLGKRGM